MQRPKVRTAFGLATNELYIFVIEPRHVQDVFGSDLIWEAYRRESTARLAPKLGSYASTNELTTGDIENTTRVPVGDDLSYNEWFLKRI